MEIGKVIDEIQNLNRENKKLKENLKVLNNNFIDIAKGNHNLIYPLTFETMNEGDWVWQNSAKTYRRIAAKSWDNENKEYIMIGGCRYDKDDEDSIIGHFFKFDFN